MTPLKPVRGTRDILPEDILAHRHVEATGCRIARLYGYEEISTPIFEFTEVFARTLGVSSDIVTKEMYTFNDKKGRSLTLRPEGTAGVARAFISHLRSKSLPVKLFYQGPMFRYERAQKGRQRQFHQIGVELLGVEGPLGDVEVISMAAHVLDVLEITDKVKLELNTLGDSESRRSYQTKLVDYLEGFRDKLSKDSLARLKRNPLRILDSKDQGDREVIAAAPLLADHLNDASKAFFDEVEKGLKTSGIDYTINPMLVRGLDYYCHTAFEFTTRELGAQGAVLAGGRYDGLVEQMGGPPTPGIGWAAGVERLALMIDAPPDPARPIAILPDGAEAEAEALTQARRFRHAGFTIDLGYSGNMSKRMKRAGKAHAVAAVIIGKDELARDAAIVRDMDSGEQTEVSLQALESHLDRYR